MSLAAHIVYALLEVRINPGDVVAAYQQSSPFVLTGVPGKGLDTHTVYFKGRKVGTVALHRSPSSWFSKYLNWLNEKYPYDMHRGLFKDWLNYYNSSNNLGEFMKLTGVSESELSPEEFFSQWKANPWRFEQRSLDNERFVKELTTYFLGNQVSKHAYYSQSNMDGFINKVLLRHAKTPFKGGSFIVWLTTGKNTPKMGVTTSPEVEEALINPDKFLSDYATDHITLRDTVPPSHNTVFCYNGKPLREIGVSTQFKEEYEHFYNWANRRWPFRPKGMGTVQDWIRLLTSKNAFTMWKQQHKIGQMGEARPIINPDKFITGYMNRPFIVKPDKSHLFQDGQFFIVVFEGNFVDGIQIPPGHPHAAKEYEQYYNWLNQRRPYTGGGSDSFWAWMTTARNEGMGILDWKKSLGESDINPDAFLTSFVRHRFRVQWRGGPVDVYYGHQYLDTFDEENEAEAKRSENYYNWLNSGPWEFNWKTSAAKEFIPWLEGASKAGLWDDFQKRNWEERQP